MGSGIRLVVLACFVGLVRIAIGLSRLWTMGLGPGLGQFGTGTGAVQKLSGEGGRSCIMIGCCPCPCARWVGERVAEVLVEGLAVGSGCRMHHSGEVIEALAVGVGFHTRHSGEWVGIWTAGNQHLVDCLGLSSVGKDCWNFGIAMVASAAAAAIGTAMVGRKEM